MNAAQRELYRAALLQVLETPEAQSGFSAAVIAVHVSVFGFAGVGAAAAFTELRYLMDKGFVETPSKTISPEIQTWRITAAGRDWLAQNGGVLS